MPSNCEIKRLGIYSSRHAYLHIFNVQDIIKEETFPDFIKFFKERVNKEYNRNNTYLDSK
ncbi:hypothetical protein TDSAC_0756 [Thermodesulfobium acidiphilum]|uniref:Uncharacterized protein n=1 Tax=Thermodesulfobium acidiphilum TaxID=1794699 RepID=A0A2R4VZZ8_THEAF|nr:hypothetical protein [Thermodesulfobium acidiphilum]AWB10119.1 hypothetical protein TDSAC_0756 [Thermodesulfobium acidiphilum]